MKRPIVLIGLGVMGKRHGERLWRRGLEICAELDTREAVKNFFQDYPCITPCKRGNQSPVLFIASPAKTHFEYALMGLKAGFDVFVEKPLALSGQEARELLLLAREKERILFPGHSERYHSGFSALKKVFPEYAGGKISFIRHNPPSGRGLDVSVAFDLLVHDLEMFFALAETKNYEIISVEKKSEDFIEMEILCGNYKASFSVNRGADKLERLILLEKGKKRETLSFAEWIQWDALDKEHETFFSSTFDSLKKEQESATLAVEVASKVDGF